MLTKKINKKQVEEFLLRNPDFFCESPNILSKLNFPVRKDNKTRKVISFKDWMINNLKLEKEEIINNAKHNFFTQQKIHKAVINIIEKNKEKDFFYYLNKELPNFFDLSVINLISSNTKLCEDFNLIYLPSEDINKIYNSKNFLLMDAYDSKAWNFKKKNLFKCNFFFR